MDKPSGTTVVLVFLRDCCGRAIVLILLTDDTSATPCLSTPAESTPESSPVKMSPAKSVPSKKGLDFQPTR